MADFGIDITLINENELNEQINNFGECLKKAGLFVEINTDGPGIGSILKANIRIWEKSIIRPYEPLIALYKALLISLPFGSQAPTVFLVEIEPIISSIQELLTGLPTSIIEFVVEELIEPWFDNSFLPIPTMEGFIEIITKGLTFNKIPWEEWFNDNKMRLPENLLNLDSKIIQSVLTLFKTPKEKSGIPRPEETPIAKIFQLMLFPITFTIGLLETILSLVPELAVNIFKTLDSISEILSNPVNFILGMIGDIMAPIVAEMVEKFLPPGASSSGLKIGMNQLFETIFSTDILTISSDDLKDTLDSIFNSIPPLIFVKPFIHLFTCFIKWLINLLSPDTILGLFGLNIPNIGFPPIDTNLGDSDTTENNTVVQVYYDASQRKLYLNEDCIELFQPSEEDADVLATFFHKDLNQNFDVKVIEVTEDYVKFEEDKTNGIDDLTEGGKIIRK